MTDFAGNAVFETGFEAKVPANGAVRLGTLSEGDVLNGRAAEDVVVVLTAQGFEAPANVVYLRDPKDLRLPAAELDVVVNEAESTVRVTARGHLARFVKLDLPQGNVRFSDNFFDLLPGESKTVRVTDRTGEPVSLARLSVSALNVKQR
ncbi:hypothetical protein PACILC2_38140 [Paenibacillus cisolokensis]|uniref:Fibronectin type III-like domain-containing protein n=1 Tax=Paenibacillus cisolokensis TaxID=1658519 RepID=A0ABQ4NAN3_9BACL|nr:hypothetical protein PACILC2_38140 [Paenibacillus cisolokensis]